MFPQRREGSPAFGVRHGTRRIRHLRANREVAAWIYTPDVIDDFIMSPDGKFIGEEGSHDDHS